MSASARPQFSLAQTEPGTLGVSGSLTFATAAAALDAMVAAVSAPSAPTRLDLSGVERSDSAGLACVLAVLAEAASRGRALAVAHVPANMRTLAQVCEVDSLLA